MTNEERAVIKNLAEFCEALLDADTDTPELELSKNVYSRFSAGYSDEYYSKAFLNVGKLLSDVKAENDRTRTKIAKAMRERS